MPVILWRILVCFAILSLFSCEQPNETASSGAVADPKPERTGKTDAPPKVYPEVPGNPEDAKPEKKWRGEKAVREPEGGRPRAFHFFRTAYRFENKLIPFGRRISDRALPDGFTRLSLDPGWPLWVRELPLMPDGEPRKFFSGEVVKDSSDVLGIVAVPVLGPTHRSAQMAVTLWSYYKLYTKEPNGLRLRTNYGQFINWDSFRTGTRYLPEDMGTRLAVNRDGRKVGPAYKEKVAFRDFLRTVFNYVGPAALVRFLSPLQESDLRPGDVYVQADLRDFRRGEVAVIVDAAENPEGQRIFLMARGSTPAGHLYLVKPKKGEGTGDWFTLRGWISHAKADGVGYWRRFQ